MLHACRQVFLTVCTAPNADDNDPGESYTIYSTVHIYPRRIHLSIGHATKAQCAPHNHHHILHAIHIFKMEGQSSWVRTHITQYSFIAQLSVCLPLREALWSARALLPQELSATMVVVGAPYRNCTLESSSPALVVARSQPFAGCHKKRDTIQGKKRKKRNTALGCHVGRSKPLKGSTFRSKARRCAGMLQ